MAFRRYLSMILTFLMLNPIWAAPLFGRSRGGWKKYSPGQLHVALRVLGTGRDARVAGKLRDKTTFSGYVSQVEPTRFLVMDAQTTQVIPVSYINVKELRAENAVEGVQFAARVSLSLNLDVDQMAPDLSPGNQCCHPKHEWIAAAVAGGFLLFLLIAVATAKD